MTVPARAEGLCLAPDTASESLCSLPEGHQAPAHSWQRCGWKIRWGTTEAATTACDREHTVPGDWRERIAANTEHEGFTGWSPGQRIHWYSGDRREYLGDWPGYCAKVPGKAAFEGGCTLPSGHHGRCAP